MIIKRAIIWFIAVSLVIPGVISAHSGGTNDQGCHNDNINGGYHCHNSKSSGSSGGGEILVALIVVGLAYWYFLRPEPTQSDWQNSLENISKKNKNYSYSLIASPDNKSDAVAIQFGFKF